MSTDIMNFTAGVQLNTKTAHKQLQDLAEFMQNIFGKSVDVGGQTIDLSKIATNARKAGSSTRELRNEWQSLLSVIKAFGGSLSSVEDMSSLTLSMRDNMGTLRKVTQSYFDETANHTNQTISVYERQQAILSQIVETSRRLEQEQGKMRSSAKKYGEESQSYQKAAESAKYYEGVLRELYATAEKAGYEQSQKYLDTKGKIGHKNEYAQAVVVDEQQTKLTKQYLSLVSQLWKEEEKLAKLRAQKRNSGEIQAEKQYKDELEQQVNVFEQKNAELVKGIKGTNEYNTALAQHNSILQQTTAHYEKTTTLLGKVKANFKNIFAGVLEAGLSWKLFSAGTSAIKNGIEIIKELDKAVTDLRIATGYSQEQVRSMVKEYNQMAQDLGATTTDISSAADSWLRMGYSAEESNTLIKNSMILSKIGQLEAAEATQYLVSAMKGYSQSGYDKDVEKTIEIVDKLAAVDLKSATSAGGLAEAMSRTANSADLAGVSMDKLIGYIATVAEVTQRDEATVGESFKTLFARLQKVAANAKVDDEGEPLNEVESVLMRLGITLRTTQDEFRNMGDVLDEIGLKWEQFNSVDQAQIATAIAGKQSLVLEHIVIYDATQYKYVA